MSESDIDRGLLKVDFIRARDDALSLYALGTSVFPSVWRDHTSRLVVSTLSSFALHARRLKQAFGDEAFDDVDASWSPFTTTASKHNPLRDEPIGSSVSFLKSYRHCLNRIVHAQKIAVGWAGTDRIWDEPSGPAMPSYVVVKTDKLDYDNVSLPGLARAFLGPVAAHVVQHAPYATV